MNYNSIGDLPPKYQKQARAKIDDLSRGKRPSRTVNQNHNKNRCEDASEALVGKRMVRSKYGNHKIEIDGIVFDSKAEGKRYLELKELEKLGAIIDLELQPEFELQPAYTGRDGKRVRPITYIGDFRYIETQTGAIVVEDVKGHQTKEYRLKKKLFGYKYGYIDFREVKA